MKPSIKIIISYSLLLVFVIASFFGRHTVRKYIKNPDAVVLSVINCSRYLDFPDGWKVRDVVLTQNSDQKGDAFAICEYRGVRKNALDGQSKMFLLSYRIYYPAKKTVDLDQIYIAEFPAKEVFFPEFLLSGGYYASNCIKDTIAISCTVGAKYEKTLMYLRLYAEGKVNITDIEFIINNQLSLIRNYYRKN